MQKARGYGLLVHLKVRKDERDAKRMYYVGLSALSLLVAVIILCEIIGSVYYLYISVGMITAYPVDELKVDLRGL